MACGPQDQAAAGRDERGRQPVVRGQGAAEPARPAERGRGVGPRPSTNGVFDR